MKRVLETLLALILALSAVPPIQAQDWLENLKAQPGYVDFGNLSETLGAEPKVQIALGGPMLNFLASASGEDDPEMAKMLQNLSGIRVNVFELNNGDAEAARARVHALAQQLVDNQWQPTVQVNDPKSPMNLFIKPAGDHIAGLAMMVVSGDSQAVFINVVGNVDPAALGRLAGELGISMDLGMLPSAATSANSGDEDG